MILLRFFACIYAQETITFSNFMRDDHHHFAVQALEAHLWRQQAPGGRIYRLIKNPTSLKIKEGKWAIGSIFHNSPKLSLEKRKQPNEQVLCGKRYCTSEIPAPNVANMHIASSCRSSPSLLHGGNRNLWPLFPPTMSLHYKPLSSSLRKSMKVARQGLTWPDNTNQCKGNRS
jgi:hypothetical protein